MVRVRRLGRAVLLFGILLALVIPASAGGLPAPPVDDGASTASPAVQPPDIVVWYGPTQSFGTLGNPQLEINVVGNVARADTLSYKLNGAGSWTPVAIGKVTTSVLSQQLDGLPYSLGGLNLDPVVPDAPLPGGPDSPDLSASPRLEDSGDFNVEILTSSLSNGSNTLELRAVGAGGEDTETVTINYAQGTTWPIPYSIDWSAVSTIADAVQIVDGEWDLEADSIRPSAVGYDRMVTLGDVGWTNYQVTVPVTIHSFPDDNSGGVGVVSRWQGHFQVGDEQPGNGWWHIGAYAFVLNRDSTSGGRRMAIYTGKTDLEDDPTGYVISEGHTYMYKLRAQTKEAGKSGFYSFRIWEPSVEAEPTTWMFEIQDAPPDEMFSGSVGLLAHDAIASFGDVEVVPVLSVETTVVGSGAVNVSPGMVSQSDAYLYGDNIQIEAVPDTGWSFAGWSGDLDGSLNPKSLALTSDLDVVATFVQGEARRLDLTVTGAGEIEQDPPGPWYGDGTVTTFRPIAPLGWEFSGWSGPSAGDVSDNGNGTWSLTMNGDKTLTGAFAKKQYTLTISVTGSGSVARNPNATTYAHGTEVELTPNPAAGWGFTGWSGDLTGAGNPATIYMDGPKAVTAHFRDVNVGPLEHDSHTIDDDQVGDSNGNNDGVANCGETIDLAVGVANRGTVTATSVNAALSTDSLYVTWTGGSTSSYPDIAGAATQSNAIPFGFKVADNAPNGHTISFDIDMVSTNGGLQSDSFQVVVSCAGSEGTVDRQVATRDDDAEEKHSGNHKDQVFLGGRDLELGEDDGVSQTVGARFQNVTIPKGAAIAEAYLEFTADEEGSIATNLVFYTQASDDAPAFVGSSEGISSLTKSTTSVAWSGVLPWTTVGADYQTPNLAPIVQEIVNRSGWQSGNALAFLITGEGTRTAVSYDGDPDDGPRLHVEYGRDPVCYNLNTSASPVAGGIVSASPPPNCGGNKYIEGTTVTVTATANPGWSYSGWGGDLSGTTNPATLSMDGVKSITAGFTKEQYLLNVTAVGLGTVIKDPDKASYDYGEQVKLTALGTGGYAFAGWSGDLSGTVSPAWISMTSHKSVTAVFGEVGPLAYVTHVIDDDDTGPSNGNGDGFVDCGERVEMTVTLYNQGRVAAESVNGTLSEIDPYVSLPGNVTSSFGTIPGMASASSLAKFEFEAGTDTPHLHHAEFSLGVSATNGGPWPVSFSVPISCLDNAGKVDKAVVASSDDAEEQISDGTVTLLGPSLEMGQDPVGTQWVGLRFQDLIIPQGATIDEAYVEFTAGQTGSGATALTIRGQDSDDTLPFSSASQSSTEAGGSGSLEASSHNISARPRTSATVNWSSVPAWSVGQNYQSPDLAPVIQEIVNRGGWKPGNSMALLIEGSGRRTAFSYDGQATLAPRLHITFGGDLTCYTLGTSATPPSGGAVTRNPGANCGAAKYLEGTSVELTPVPALDHSFTGWTGDLTGMDSPATIVMNANKQVSAGFQAETCFTLTTGLNPPGTGTIVPTPPPNCGGGKYVAGTSVGLQAVPEGIYIFDGWTGTVGPSTDNPITVVVDADKTLTANFTTCHTLTLVPDPSNAGTVQADPPPDCGVGLYRAGTDVTLTAVPNVGFTFTNWGGAVTGTVNPTSVSVIGNMVVTASFEAGTCTSLSLRANPVGAGTVSANPPPNCEGTKYMPGTSVQLTAMPRSGFKLVQWSGAASGADNPTTIVVGIANTATAEFGLVKVESTIRLPIMAR